MSPKTKTIITALGVGAAVEGGFCAVLLILGGIGPCGPTSVVSAVVLAVHAPAFLAALAMEALGIPEQATTFIAVAIQVSLWSGMAHLWLGRGARPGGRCD